MLEVTSQFWTEIQVFVVFLAEIVTVIPPLLIDALTGALAISCVMACINLITMVRGDRN